MNDYRHVKAEERKGGQVRRVEAVVVEEEMIFTRLHKTRKKMDTTALTAKIEADKQAVSDAQAALDAVNKTLSDDEAELAQAGAVNAIESGDISAINAALKADGSTLQVVDTASN